MEDFSNTELKKLIALFVEEATEKISEIEESLLLLENEPENKELIHRIFRAVHTIKGTSASLGFKNISQFAHRVEEVLDLMRKGKINPDKRIIDSIFKSTDIFKRMLHAASEGSDYDLKGCEKLFAELKNLKTCSQKRVFKIIFSPHNEMLLNGLDPAVIIEDIKASGRVLNIKAYTDAIPVFSEIDPKRLYLRWDIIIETEQTLEQIKERFKFLEDDEIQIIPVSPSRTDVPLIGEVLVESGKVSEKEISEALAEQKRVGTLLYETGRISKDALDMALHEQAERTVDAFRKSLSSTIRVDLKKLDNLLNLVGEMVIIHSMLEKIIRDDSDNGTKVVFDYSSYDILQLFTQLQRIGRHIQESTMSLRMLPVGEVSHRFKRLVREISMAQNKKVELLISGEETELDKGVIEKITDPLVHLIRNAIDHGIETPEERVKKGKPERGIINISAYQIGDSVYIEVEDDGRGLDREKIIEKAISMGLVEGAAGLPDEYIYNLIFLPGFSTSDKTTDISGRGVGMDVVKRNVEALNGRIYIRTKRDIGTTITIKLPLTLAIIDGLAIGVGDEIYIIPLQSVLELVKVKCEDFTTVTEKLEILNVRDEAIPVIRLCEVVGLEKNSIDDSAIAIITAHEGRKFALIVDRVLGQQQIVVKGFGGALPRIKAIGGCTILGDGRVALVLDLAGLLENPTNTSTFSCTMGR